MLVEELIRQGVGHFVLSPGSRSTPLTVAVAENTKARHTIHFDERSAGFLALGLAQGSGKPVALVSTSGSAVANYWPAVVEASASRTPLILLTADRPPELLDCGANQAIDQNGIFGRYVRDAVNLPTPDANVAPAFLLTTIARALRAAHGAPAGPVQLNTMFREPLAPVPDDSVPEAYLANIERWLEGEEPYTRWWPANAGLDPAACEEVAARAAVAYQPLLVVGRLTGHVAREGARELGTHLGWPVFADVCSGLRFDNDLAHAVPHYDLLLQSEELRAAYRPDFVLHVGGAVTSKRLQQHLAAVRPVLALLNDHPLRQDPDHLVAFRLEGALGPACRRLKALLPKASSETAAWGGRLREASDTAYRTAVAAVAEAGLSEIAVARQVSRARPEGGVLFLGNSMPVREMDMFGDATGAPGVTAANRGASGIDGNIATAVGYARATGQPVIAVIGDLTALHDLNALALLRGMETPFVLVVVNNDGGGIFHFLPIANYENVFEPCFGTPHGLGFAHAAQMFGLPYAAPETPEDLDGALKTGLTTPGPTLIEVRTDRPKNIALHRAVQAKLQALELPRV